jgi:hypothetical protein
MNQTPTLRSELDRLQRLASVAAVLGAGLCVLGYFLQPVQFFRSYLFGYMFWLGITLGCLAVLMIHHLVGGAWGAVTRRILESGTRTILLMVLLGIPLYFGLHDLYSWAGPEGAEGAATASFRHLYLSLPFFLWRAAFYFVAWLVIIGCLNYWSRQQERARDEAVVVSRNRRLNLLSAGGMVVYGLTVTFAGIDWMMSLESHWFSTLYGFLVISGQLLAAMAFATLMTAFLAHTEPLSSVLTPGIYNDLGNLLLAFVMLWAYCAFSQLLITWSGNLPEEIQWYLQRSRGGWDWIRLLLLLFHFAVPFFLLLSRGVKRNVALLKAVTATLLVMHLVDLFWLIMPAFFPEQLHVHWLDLAAPLGLGGCWIFMFAWHLKRRSPLPMHDPRLQEVVQHG